MDTRLYTSVGSVTRSPTEHYELMEEARAVAEPANGIEILGGKVVKFLLTEKGSDAFEPEYGGTALHHTQISQSFIPKLRLELLEDLDRCAQFIKRSDLNIPLYSDAERLYALNLKDVQYNRQTPNRLDVYLEIISTTGKREVVTITNNTDR